MLSHASILRRKNTDKVEGMASWLILGGFLPLDVAASLQEPQGFNIEAALIPERFPYVWVIAMGIASLLVKRASTPWRFIVALGVIGFLTAAAMDLIHSEFGGLLWPIAALLVVLKQYHYDTKSQKRQIMDN
ncbi:hypothetical protein RZS28_11435 [Methylocapsa polymorpha]|uniref:Uncharacterized protein n=1 Tax=Methylocapsa polymorpha TaxID=3080828 RepID=A0ABZ0HR82_9HYPH|nr:hypothetical protein RZS28_11435 [Methylocapsa sp. RX1]